MKSLQDNFFVNIARGYVTFFYWCFPLIVIVKCILLIYNPTLTSQQTNTVLLNVDLLGLFGNEKFITAINFNTVVLWLLILVVNASIIAGIYYGLIKLKKFLKNVYEDRPFIQENGKHLKVIGTLVMALSTLIYIAKHTTGFLSSLQISNDAYIKVFEILINLFLKPALGIGLIVFVIGEIIVRAAEMKEEQDLTV